MRAILSLILVFFILPLQATTYYVSASGSDTAGGTTPETAWQTLRKVSLVSYVAGDQVVLKKGDTFYGTLNIGSSGTQGHPITVGAYGSGASPVIMGFTTVTGWTNPEPNIWESVEEVSTLATCNLVSVNGVNTPMGRTPNLGSYFALESHQGNTSITSSNLTGIPDWRGAQVVMRKERWIWQTGTIIKQKGGIITYTDEGKFTPRDQWGFFIQQDPHTLDAQNEWYYNPKNKRIRLYSTSQPTSVKVASREYATDLIGRSYLIMEGLTLSGTNTIGIGQLYAPAAIFSTAEITSPAPSAMTTTSGQDSPTNIRGPTTTRTWPGGRLSQDTTCTHTPRRLY